jgi:hypothetical protein
VETSRNTANVLEFRKTSHTRRIQATGTRPITIPLDGYELVRFLAQEKYGATFKLAKDLPPPNKKPLLYWILGPRFIFDLQWDPGDWHWQQTHKLGDAPFFGYSSKRGYQNARKSHHPPGIINFIQSLNLRNSTTAQVVARIWHNACPRKVGAIIWLTLNKGLPVGTWLQTMGLPATCKGCDQDLPEYAQHCLMECPLARKAWNTFRQVWTEWEAPNRLSITWRFVLLGEAVFEEEDDPLDLQSYHTGGFSYRRQPLDILRSFLLYFLWSERCRKHFDGQYSLRKILLQSWEATVEVGMATWKAIKSSSQDRNQVKQLDIEQAFKAEWLHGHILREDKTTIAWRLLPPLYFLNFSND